MITPFFTSCLWVQETGARYCPLANVPGSRGKLHVVNSNLSELAVMAFELGYSWEDPRNMVRISFHTFFVCMCMRRYISLSLPLYL